MGVTLHGVEQLYGGDLRGVLDAAALAEEAGLDEVVLPDHVVLGPRTDRYPYGAFPSDPGRSWPEPLVLLAAVAARTSVLLLSTAVLVSPLRPAPLLAKAVATLDAISGGRVRLGVGSGWQREEYDACGVPFAGRGRRLEEQIRACAALWASGPATFRSTTVSFEDLWCVPAPVEGRVPIWFGGPGSDRTGDRIAELGHGWLPLAGTTPAEVRAGIEVIGARVAAAGREPSDIGVRATVAPVRGSDGEVDLDATVAAARPFLEAGATGVTFPLAHLVRRPFELPEVLGQLTRAACAASADGDRPQAAGAVATAGVEGDRG